MAKNKERERVQQFKDVITNAFSDKGEHYKFMDHNIKIIYGDLNFRVNLNYYSVLETVDSMTSYNFDEKLNILLNNDQLNQLKLDYKWLYWFKEMPINFLPTFKYDKNSEEYDTSKKQRVPSWCDRILWYHNDTESSPKDEHNYVSPIIYERRETTFSDHRPVVAYFELQCYHHNARRKSSFKRNVLSKSKTRHIEKKPHYDPENTKIDKDFEILEAFDMPSGAPDEPIHLDLGINHSRETTKPSVEEVKYEANEDVEDFISLSNKPINPDSDDLIEISEKDDGNLINFKQSKPLYQSANQYFQSQSMNTNQMGYGYGIASHPMPYGPSMGYQQYPQSNFGYNYTNASNNMMNKPSNIMKESPAKPLPTKETNTQDFFKF